MQNIDTFNTYQFRLYNCKIHYMEGNLWKILHILRLTHPDQGNWRSTSTCTLHLVLGNSQE